MKKKDREETQKTEEQTETATTTTKDNKEAQLIEWRRSKVLELSAQGHSQVSIADILHVSPSTISRDMDHIKQQAKESIKSYVQDKLPQEVHKCFVSLDLILREAWMIANNTDEEKTKLQALNLVKETFAAKMDLVSNVDIIQKVIEFVNEKTDKLFTDSVNKTVSIEQKQEDKTKSTSESEAETTQGPATETEQPTEQQEVKEEGVF